jgi:hypothetical protein
MATTNRTSGNEKQNFKQIEGDGWSSLYLPAICAGVVMTIVLFMAVSCSKKSGNITAKISPPAAPAVESPAPATTAALPEVPKKAVKKHRPTNATYVNGTYGVSFSYPRKYSLKAGIKHDELPVEAGFAKSGAVEIASVDMPDGLYSDTDYSGALLNVSVNTGLSADECGQFAKANKESETAKPTGDSAKASTDAIKPAAAKLGSNEFTTVEQMKENGENQSDLKYFHLFKNGACYEFALDVETFRKGDEDLAQVDRGKVFQQLERILRTTKIKDVELPGVEATGKAPASLPPSTSQTVVSAQPVSPAQPAQPVAATQQTEKAQVVTPEHK